MGRLNTKGTRQMAVEVTTLLADEFKAFCKGRGETVRQNLEAAMRRHMDNPPPPLVPPPPPVYPPLPPVTPPGGGKPKSPGKGKKS